MQYLNQSDETSCATAPYSDKYICLSFIKIRFRGYLIIANYINVKSIEGL